MRPKADRLDTYLALRDAGWRIERSRSPEGKWRAEWRGIVVYGQTFEQILNRVGGQVAGQR